MQEGSIIVADRLTRAFGTTVAVDGLSMRVEAGEIFGFLGHNGAGKTTTIRMLNGVLAPTSGSCSVFGLSPMGQGPAVRRRTGVLTETPSLEERLTARENLRIYGALYGVGSGELTNRVEEALEIFGLADRADEKVGGFSKGMKQRLALARTLLHNPEILFLDEPSAGLDPVAARQVHELILRLSHEQRHTVFLCTHNLDEAQQLCDRVGVLEHGRLIAVGTPAELAHQVGRTSSLELEVAPEDRPKALATLRAIPGVVDVAEKNGCLVAQGIRRPAIPGLLGTLIQEGVRVYRVSPREPTLEDVYFALHAEEVER